MNPIDKLTVVNIAPALTNYNIKHAQKHFENLESITQQEQQSQRN